MFTILTSTPAAAGDMSSIMSSVTTVATTVISLIGDFVGVIVDTPYLMIGVSLMVAGAGVGFISRLIRT